ncbi:MAG: cysteine desulfurase-like protein [Planctomycetales bacterium]|nr:cysteine desulfurase-like protein [Planctomycetales bacterium]
MTLATDRLRPLFPALAREHAGREAVYFDGPAGTQTPIAVIDAIGNYLRRCNANHGGLFATSRESDQLLHETHEAVAALLGADDPDTVSFGANMTTLTFAFSRALSRTWAPGDEVIVTRLDHDANVTPWTLAARDAGATVKTVELTESLTLDIEDFRSKLSERTKLVAVGAASNSTGAINPVRAIADAAHAAGALVFVDAVHYAPHQLLDVRQMDCDFLACSAYKFFGPHVGILWGRREWMESLEPYKVRPAANRIPDRWMTGTQNHECLAGVKAAVEYLAEVAALAGDSVVAATAPLRERLVESYRHIQEHERSLCGRLLAGIAELPAIRVWGEADPQRQEARVSTLSITHRERSSTDVATHLAERGVFAWNGNYYALNLTESLGLEPDGMVRLGIVHYNTEEEVDYVLSCLREL